MYTLENEQLAVQLYQWPGVKEYTHKATGIKLQGSGPDGKLAVNGEAADWEEWDIEGSISADLSTALYRLRWRRNGLAIRIEYRLENNAVEVTVTVTDDHSFGLQQLDWINQPLLACSRDDFTFARSEVRQKSWKLIPGGGRGIYDRQHVSDLIADAVPDRTSVPTMHACVYNGSLCSFVTTNYPVMPLLSEAAASQGSYPGRADTFSISPNTYQYRVRNQTMEPLVMKAVFLTDINGDGIADECDYHLWLNRQFPDADPLYKEAVWYQVFCAEKERGVLTTFKETLDIIRQIYHITGGIPQIAYLIGWQFEGHDTGYPSLNRINPQLAENPDHAREELLELIRRARDEYNCIVSYHINLDDGYVDAPDWDEAILSRNPDGTPRIWIDTEKQRAYHICHTKDVESGKVFKRIDEFLELVPVHRTVQVDALRNTNASWDDDGYIGPVEELICGMKPILAYFQDRGIDVSTEGQNGMPIEDSGIFSAYWHYSPSLLYHGKIVGGGSFGMNAVTWGKGASFDSDILYRGEPTRLAGEQFKSNDFESSWNQIVDILYLGSILYHFYLSREMVEWRENEENAYIRYGDGVTVNIDKKTEQLAVKWGQLTIADNDDRFIPIGHQIYMYSRYGTQRSWKLPEEWVDSEIIAYQMSGAGKERIDTYAIIDGSIQIKLDAHVPVILEKI